RLDALAKLSPQCGEPGGILDQLGRPLDVLILTPSDEVCETRVVQQRRAGARYGRAAREADDGDAHPERIARRRAAAVRVGVERDVDRAIGVEVVGQRLAADEGGARLV